jgi:hypothetical protein
MPVLTTVGKTAGGEATTTSTADNKIDSMFTASAGGTHTAGHARAWLDASGSTNTQLLVYADSSGEPGALLAASDELAITATSESVRDYAFSGAEQITMSAGVAYWLALTWDDPGSPSIVYSRDTTSSVRRERSDITYGTPPDPFGTATGSFSGPIDVWVDLNGTTTVGGGTTTSPTVRSSDADAKDANSDTFVDVSTPAGLAEDDYLIGFASGDADIVLSTMTAAGFTPLSSQAGHVTDNYPPVKLFGKVASAADAAATGISFDFGTTGDGAVILAAITAGTYDPAAPVAVGPYTTQARTSDAEQTAPSTTGVADGLLFVVFATDTNNSVQSYPSSGPAGFTRLATVQGTPHYAMIGVYQKALTAAGATGSASVTPTGAGTDNGWTATAVVVNPKITGGGGGGAGSTATLGKTDAGSSSSASSTNKTAVSLVTATADGTLTEGHAHAWLDSAGTTNTKVVVYADTAGAPGSLLAESDVVALTITADAVTDYVFSGANAIDITNGTDYWVGLAWQDPGTPSLNLGRDATASARQEVNSYAPDPFGVPTAQSGPVAVWVVTEEAATGGGGTGTEGYSLIATVDHPTTTYFDETIATSSGQTRGVGGIPTPAAGPGVVLVTADSSSRLSITTDGRTYDGGGHTVAGVTIEADDIIIQNFVIAGAERDGVSIFGTNVTVQNCDFYDIAGTGEDINAITLFGDGHKILYNDFGVTDFLASGDIGGSHTDVVQSWNTSSKRSTSNLIVQGNRAVGPATSDERFIHQFLQMEGEGSTDGGGGGSGVSSGILVADNLIEFDCENQVLNFLDVHDIEITRNTFAGSSNRIVGTGDGSDGVVFYDDNIITGDYSNLPSETAGPGPAGVGGGTGTPGDGGVPVEYAYIVTAVDAAGNESGGAPGSGSGGPPDTEPPTTPTNLAAAPGDGRISLTWDASTDNVGVVGYLIYRDTVFLATATATSFVDVDVVNGTEYDYVVFAYDLAGNASGQSNTATATPASVPLGGVALLPGKLTGGKIEVAIAWGADLAANEATWTWSDVTTDVRQDPGISTAAGRNDEASTSNPAHLTLVLDNSSGDYSLGTGSAHYPYVRRNTPVRVKIDPGDGIGGRIVILAFADGFTPGWDSQKGHLPVVTLSASGTLRRLAQGSAPIQSAYRRVMTALDSVVAYWPFEEGTSAQYAPAVRGGDDMALSVDSATPNATPGRPDWRADDSFDCSAPLPALGRAYFQADVDAYTDTGASQVRCLLAIPDDGLTDGTVLMHVSMTGTIHRWDITYRIVNGATALALHRYNASDGSLNSFDLMNLGELNGRPGRLSLDWTQSGSNIVWTLSYREADPDVDSALFVRDTLAGQTLGIVDHIEINPHNADMRVGFGHLTVENRITSVFAGDNTLVANIGEDATGDAGRLARLCAENLVPLQSYDAAGTLGDLDEMGPQLVAPLLDLLHECEVADQGQIWDGRDPGLSYTTRRRRGVGTVKLTVNAAAGELAGEFQAVDDDQRNRNRMTVTRLHGVAVTHEDVDGPLGTAAIGIYDDALTVNTRYDASVPTYAAWLVTLGTVEGYRYPTVTVDLAASPSLAGAVLDIVPGERIEVTGLDTTLAGFPDSSVSLIVEGIAHEITTRQWRVTFRCSPYAPWATGLDGS